MLQRFLFICGLSICVHAAPGDPVTLDLQQERNQRNAQKMLRLLKSVSDYSLEDLIRNGDEELFATDYRGNFGKSLAWNSVTFHKTEYDKLLAALASQDEADFALLLGGAAPDPQVFKLVNPQAMFALDFEGADQWNFGIEAAPTLSSAQAAGEMVELYWHALLRDVPFNEYSNTSGGTLIQERALAGLNALSNFEGPKISGNVTGQTMFRGIWSGELVGPYISQFLYLPIPLGPLVNYDGSGSAPFNIPAYQELLVPLPDKTTFVDGVVVVVDENNQITIDGELVPAVTGTVNVNGTDYEILVVRTNFMINESEWEDVQRGKAPSQFTMYDQTRRWFIRNGRDLAEYVHYDYPGQAGVHAALILLSFGSSALDSNIPYLSSTNQESFVTFGKMFILSTVIKVAELALKAAWFQKWYVHRRLRPEAFGYLVEKQATSLLDSQLHDDLMTSSVLGEQFFVENGTKLLPIAYPEGSPCHPSYPAGHATIAGAVVTILKAFFNENFVIPGAVQPNAANDTLIAYNATMLTVGQELNKLASNISIGRNIAGVHYRSDGTQGMLLGEKVALKFLNDLGSTYHESFNGFSLTKFDGSVITEVGKKLL